MKAYFELDTDDVEEMAKKLTELRQLENALAEALRGAGYAQCEDWFNSRPEKMAF
jgi:hypothetical protein